MAETSPFRNSGVPVLETSWLPKRPKSPQAGQGAVGGPVEPVQTEKPRVCFCLCTLNYIYETRHLPSTLILSQVISFPLTTTSGGRDSFSFTKNEKMGFKEVKCLLMY
jgi:hypothetical protein